MTVCRTASYGGLLVLVLRGRSFRLTQALVTQADSEAALAALGRLGKVITAVRNRTVSQAPT